MAEQNKTRWNRTVIGSVKKPKDETKPVYLNIRTGPTAKALIEALNSADQQKGLSISLESPDAQKASADAALSAGKISPEIHASIMQRIESIPDYVRFECVMLQKQ